MKNPATNISFLIGYNNKLCAEGYASLIYELYPSATVEILQNGKKIINELKTKRHYFLVLDLIYPGCDSIEYVKEIMRYHNDMKILMISDLIKNGMMVDLLNTGIDGYLLHTCGKKDLETAIEKIVQNEKYICTSITSQVLYNLRENNKQDDNYHFTSREKEILGLLIKMNSNKRIAEKLNISELTVKTHRKNLMKKFGAKNLLALVRYACRENLVNGKNDDFCIGCTHRYRLLYDLLLLSFPSFYL